MARIVMSAVTRPPSVPVLAYGARALAPMHLSIRVPWHDSGWDGTVCRDPDKNLACLVLPRVAEEKDHAAELSCRGRRWNELRQAELPGCAAERGAFMSPFAYRRNLQHPYAEFSELHRHFADTPFEYPAWSAACVPFNWLLRSSVEDDEETGMPGLASRYRLVFDATIEPSLEFETDWIQHRSNQLLMLDTFFSAVRPQESLCFFYAKRTPLSDDPRRVIVGVGRVTGLGRPVDYQYRKRGPNDLEGMLWERNVQHSIRPDFKDGFLLPYAEILARAEPGADRADLADCIAFAPEEHWASFSYASEHVTHDGAIASLVSCSAAIRSAAARVPGPWMQVQQWISARLAELWKCRGAYPGFGAALAALDVPTPTLLAHEIEYHARSIGQSPFDPWAIFRAALAKPGMLQGVAGKALGPSFARIWEMLDPDRRSLLVLLSRFPLTENQARRWYDLRKRADAGMRATDSAILRNPYLLFELDRMQADPIPLRAVDRGMLPDESIQVSFPLSKPSALEDTADPRRLRAVACEVLARAATEEGHTLLPVAWLADRVAGCGLDTPCSLAVDHVAAAKAQFSPTLHLVPGPSGGEAIQLAEVAHAGTIIRDKVRLRVSAPRHTEKHDWQGLVDALLGPAGAKTAPDELRAREEKAAALAELFASRFSVMLGGAGTGKTTLLKALCGIPSVAAGNVLLLAPTGKARVRLERGTGRHGAQTIAQFLLHRDRFSAETGQYRLSESDRVAAEWKTVVIDESSMLTEVQLAAVLQVLQGVQRLILVGDPRQLPPIGEGRPFADIVAELHPKDAGGAPVVRFPAVGPGYAELTTTRRQATARGDAETSSALRQDVRFGSWFGGREPDPAADELWHMDGLESPYLRFVRWEHETELPQKLEVEIKAELRRLGLDADERGFAMSLGGIAKKGEVRFELAHGDHCGAARSADTWQILTPLRGLGPGVEALNQFTKVTFRNGAMQLARAREHRSIPKPMGPQGIVYGDKVISNCNGYRWNARTYYPSRERIYVANGELGMVVGKHHPNAARLEVEFQSELGKPAGYSVGDFEADPPIELAYALTVHKSQGSEFRTTFVVLPYPCRLLSRELLYTALTRHQERLVVLHQGPLASLRSYASASASAISQRLTNLFSTPALRKVEVAGPAGAKGSVFLDERLIHVAPDGTPMRSKSEVIIAQLLHAHCPKRMKIKYEHPLRFPDGRERFPDFTIWDDDRGRTFYWEHAGMMHDAAYRARWAAKLEGYRTLEILPLEEGGGPNGTLVFTEDDPRGGIDASKIRALVEHLST